MRVILPRFAILLLCLGAAPAWADAGHGHEHHAAYAAGQPGDTQQPARTVIVTMQENPDGTMGFAPSELAVHRNEQIRFELKNNGRENHEFMLDTLAHNARHKIAMERNPQMHHDDENGKQLAAGSSATVLWRFTNAGTYEFACLIPGHYEAGMHGKVTVR